MMHAILRQRGKAYFSNMVKFSREKSGRWQLRSSTTNTAAVVLKIRTQFGKRAFSVCSPAQALHLSSLDTLLHNARISFAKQCSTSSNCLVQ